MKASCTLGSARILLFTSGSDANCGGGPILASGTRKSLPVIAFLILPTKTKVLIVADNANGNELHTVAPEVTSTRRRGSSNAASRMAVPLEDMPQAPRRCASISGRAHK